MMGPSLTSGGGGGSSIISDNAESGYTDIGGLRMAWGRGDASATKTDIIAFPVPFSRAPSLHITKIGGSGVEVQPKYVTATEFGIGAYGDFRNPVPYNWVAMGSPPSLVLPPYASFDIPDLPVYSAAVRAQMSGQRNARILCIGDSTTTGFGALSTGMSANDISASYPTALSNAIAARGKASGWENFVGLHNASNLATLDTRWTFAAGNWGGTSGAAGMTLGGYALISQGGQGKANFAPTKQVDTFEVFTWAKNTSGTPTIVVSIDNVDVATISTLADNAAPGKVVRTVIKTSLGMHSINLRSPDTTQISFCGVIAYNSAVKEISVLNAGLSGGRVQDIVNGQTLAWSPLNILPMYNPDLTIYNMMINEFNQASPTDPTSFMTNNQAVIDAVKNSGSDMIIVLSNRIGTTYDSNWSTYAGYMQQLADRNKLPVIDLSQVLGTYAAANAAGDMRDTLHPTSTGYAKIATAIADIIMPAGA